MKKITLVMIGAIMFSSTHAQENYDVAEASGKFAIEIYKKFAQENDQNVFFSPFSLNIAMGMTYAGAKGETKDQIAQVFNFPNEDKNLHKDLGKLQKEFSSLATKGVEIAIANQLWADREYRFICSYLRGVKKAYGAPVKRMKFRAEPDECRVEINRWVEAQTNDRIKDLLPGGSISHLTALVLTNAIYFKGQWDVKFDPNNTVTDNFTTTNGNMVKCSMMKGQQKLNLYQGSNIKMVELPYVGKDFSMLAILPNEDVALTQFEKNFNLSDLNNYVELMTESDVKLSFPKFKFSSEYELKPTLIGLGMPLAFSNLADFTRMSKKPDLKIDEVYHKAFVEVSEEGTEAAAATAVVIVRKSIPITVDFEANRPFIFIIRENSTGNILFMGRVTNPNS